MLVFVDRLMYVWFGSVMEKRKDVIDNLSMDIRAAGVLFSWSFSAVAVTGCSNRFMLSTRKATLLGGKIKETHSTLYADLPALLFSNAGRSASKVSLVQVP